MSKYIFHIDANSAYLSWEAVYRLQHGAPVDLREIPAAVGGDPTKRKGIILAKSIPAKKKGVHTGQPLFEAKKACPDLTIVPPNYELYLNCSDAMYEILSSYTGLIERFSVDELFLEYTCEDPVEFAYTLKDRIKNTLGFTVNIGISTCKLLAKMGSEFQKPDKVHTLFKEEIKDKMWPLPVNELFMVGRQTTKKLVRYGILTIGELANTDKSFLEQLMKSHGRLIWEYANGIDNSVINPYGRPVKGLGNSTTTPFDVEDEKYAFLYILSLCEMVGARLRHIGKMCNVVSISYRNNLYGGAQRQRKLISATDNTNVIYRNIIELFKEIWDGKVPIRHFGVHVTDLSESSRYQTSIFDEADIEKKRKLNQSVDKIREKFGKESLKRASFLESGISCMNGGVYEDYPMMTSLL